MKKVMIFCEGSAVRKFFSTISNSRSWQVDFLPHEELRKTIRKAEPADLCLIDYASVEDAEKQKTLNFILRREEPARGIIDRKNEITDPASLLMKGTDYIGNPLLKAGIGTDRLNKSVDFHYFYTDRTAEEVCEEQDAEDEGGAEYIIPEGGWQGVKSGKEYSFVMLFTEIAIPAEWKKKSGEGHLSELKQTFQHVVERETGPFDGKIWIWNEYGGLVLFPFDGGTAGAVIPAIKLLLNRVLISVEDFRLHSAINLRAAIHIGTTVYKSRGKTGTIISDSINSIFHLGTQFTRLDDLDITEEVLELLPDRLQNLFTETGEFENRNIYRLKHFEVSG